MHWPSHTIWLLGSAVRPTYIRGNWGRQRWRALSQPHLGTIPARLSGSTSLVLNYDSMSNMLQMYNKGLSNIETSVPRGSLTNRTPIFTGMRASTWHPQTSPRWLGAKSPPHMYCVPANSTHWGKVVETWCLGVNEEVQISVRLFTGSEGEKTLGSGLTTSGTRHLYPSAKQRERLWVPKEWVDDHCGAGWLGIFFLSPPHGLTMPVCLSSQPFVKISQPPLASRAEWREEGGEQGAIYHCREMCCTQQGWLYSLLLLQPELQTLKKCRTCTSKISIHHRSSGTMGVAPLHVGWPALPSARVPLNWEHGDFLGTWSLSRPTPNLLQSPEIWG